ncbi:MAG: hypothetical protein KJ630_23430 [Proteobacteria bacterium]|nr:hypothetical protein [Pseudomonadota bacterium]
MFVQLNFEKMELPVISQAEKEMRQVKKNPLQKNIQKGFYQEVPWVRFEMKTGKWVRLAKIYSPVFSSVVPLDLKRRQPEPCFSSNIMKI